MTRPVTKWRRPSGGLLARFRAWFAFRVLGRDSESCDRCGRVYETSWWCASDSLWIAAYQEATGRQPNPWQGVDRTMYAGLLCPRCFAAAARRLRLPVTWSAEAVS